uniref:Secreted protein n=1 Tax=Romanomermis culicivorax TaxID=13658 RepID=A0A915KWS8_ROMCU
MCSLSELKRVVILILLPLAGDPYAATVCNNKFSITEIGFCSRRTCLSPSIKKRQKFVFFEPFFAPGSKKSPDPPPRPQGSVTCLHIVHCAIEFFVPAGFLYYVMITLTRNG